VWPEDSLTGSAKAVLTASIKAIRNFIDEAGLLAKLSQGALERAKELSWDGISDRIARSYHPLRNHNHVQKKE